MADSLFTSVFTFAPTVKEPISEEIQRILDLWGPDRNDDPNENLDDENLFDLPDELNLDEDPNADDFELENTP